MNKSKLILFLFFISLAHAQELDESFLSSLPDDIKKDVIDKAGNQDKNLDNNFRPYQYSSKIEFEEDLLALKLRMEQDLNELNNRLDKDKPLKIKEDLALFGKNFFNTFQTSFMPVNEPNPNSSYVLDVGDVLKIQLTGQKNYIDNLIINGDGSVNVPDIGRVIVAGLTLSSASDTITTKITEAFISTEVYITLGRIRDVNILVTGNANKPGIYTLSGNSNILHALTVAGGISDQGSMREINLIRDNKVIESLDMYDLLIDGRYNIKKRLRSGDVVFVESIKNIVTIDGAIKRPAKYEVKNNQNLLQVFEYANGMKQTADIRNISLERVLDGSLKSIPIINKSQFSKIKPIDGDLIYVREFPFRTAKIHGAVLKPGTYTMAAGESLKDLIEKAGGVTENAYLFGSIYETNDAREINKKSKDILYEEFIDGIIAASQRSLSENLDLTPIVRLTEQIKNSEPNGRIVVDLLDDTLSEYSKIGDGDTLFIPEKNNNVYVYGEISTEGAVMFSANKDVEYFVNKSGGYKKFADVESVYILHPNGESIRYKKSRNIFESSPKSDIVVYPGSVIFVPRKLDESTSRRIAAQAYVSILGNLGIALASLSSINNN